MTRQLESKHRMSMYPESTVANGSSTYALGNSFAQNADNTFMSWGLIGVWSRLGGICDIRQD